MHYVSMCDHLGLFGMLWILCLGARLVEQQGWVWNDPRTPDCAYWWVRSSFWQKYLVQPRGKASRGTVSLLPKAAADGGASLSGQPMTLREAIWQSCWQELLCSMNTGDSPRPEWIRMQQRWLVGQITIWWAERCSSCCTDREKPVPVGEAQLSMPWSDRHNRSSSLMQCTPWCGLGRSCKPLWSRKDPHPMASIVTK